MSRQLRVAVVGAGPAGIYAADILTKAESPSSFGSVTVDLIERDPTPFGLIRYGVAPDHPRIKEIVKALKRVLSNPDIRFFGNVSYGDDLKLDDLQRFYDAVIFATGARADRDLNIPGIDLKGSFGAADFVAWYDGHPDVDRDWPFDPDATQVAVLGVGNVGLDVARILAKTAEELLVTEIPDNVADGLRHNATTDVHVFARRGPAQVKFTPMELRELNHSPTIDVIVHPEGFELDEGSMEAIRASKSVKLVVDVLQNYLAKEPSGAAHRIHIHFCQNPVEVLGEDGRVVGLRTEVTELDGTGNVRGTGEFVDWPVQAVYRAIGYYSDNLAGLPFDLASGVRAQRRRPRHRHRRLRRARRVRDGLDQARTGRPHRPHEVGRRAHRRAAARGCRLIRCAGAAGARSRRRVPGRPRSRGHHVGGLGEARRPRARPRRGARAPARAREGGPPRRDGADCSSPLILLSEPRVDSRRGV